MKARLLKTLMHSPSLGGLIPRDEYMGSDWQQRDLYDQDEKGWVYLRKGTVMTADDPEGEWEGGGHTCSLDPEWYEVIEKKASVLKLGKAMRVIPFHGEPEESKIEEAIDQLVEAKPDISTRQGLLKYLRSKGAYVAENPDSTVDVEGDVDLSNFNLKKLPFQFGKVTGNFYCAGSQLTSLQGAPKSVGGDFGCSYNLLTSLQGAPESVGRIFDCSNNQLTSLEGAPKRVGGHFYCSGNQLTSLQGAPKSVGGNFYCSDNLDLDPAEVEAYLKKLRKVV